MKSKSNIHIRPISVNDIEIISNFFRREDFYYATKRPASLSLGEIHSILHAENHKFFIVEDTNKKIIALCDYKIDLNIYRNVTVEFRIYDEENWIETGQHAWHLFLKQLFYNFNFHKVTKYVYEFDQPGKYLCENAGFTQEAVLKESVYKLRTYSDTIVYSILQEEFRRYDAENLFPKSDLHPDFESFPLQLEGRKIKLRRIEKSDYATLYKWESSEITYTNVRNGAYDLSEENFYKEIERWEETSEEPDFIQLIVEMKSGKAIGTVSLQNIDWRNKCAELIVSIGEERLLGFGFGALATNAMTKFAYQELNLRRLYGSSYTCNERVMQSAKRAKIQYDAHLKKCIYKNGDYYDILIV